MTYSKEILTAHPPSHITLEHQNTQHVSHQKVSRTCVGDTALCRSILGLRESNGFLLLQAERYVHFPAEIFEAYAGSPPWICASSSLQRREFDEPNLLVLTFQSIRSPLWWVQGRPFIHKKLASRMHLTPTKPCHEDHTVYASSTRTVCNPFASFTLTAWT